MQKTKHINRNTFRSFHAIHFSHSHAQQWRIREESYIVYLCPTKSRNKRPLLLWVREWMKSELREEIEPHWLLLYFCAGYRWNNLCKSTACRSNNTYETSWQQSQWTTISPIHLHSFRFFYLFILELWLLPEPVPWVPNECPASITWQPLHCNKGRILRMQLHLLATTVLLIFMLKRTFSSSIQK